jgi:hypothetical protein
MPDKDNRVSFLDLMNAWREEFNESRQDINVVFDEFAGKYLCIRVGMKANMELTACGAHLFYNDEKGVEITEGKEAHIFIRAEDPSFFDRLVGKLEEKAMTVKNV